MPEDERDLMASGPPSGERCSGAFAWYDPVTSLWRTWQRCLTGEWDAYSETFPRAATMRNGIVFPQVPLAPLTDETESGSWPTPANRDWRSPNRLPYSERGGGKKGEQLPNAIGGQLNPTWVEWLMGFPLGWTDLKDSATP